MTESLEDLYQKLNFIELEEKTIHVDTHFLGDTIVNFGRHLVLRLLTEEPYNQ